MRFFVKTWSVCLKRCMGSKQNTVNYIKLIKIKDGDQISIKKTVGLDDILKFVALTGDCNPIHLMCPKNIVHGALLNGFVSSVLGTKLPGPGTIVVEQILKFPNPCYVGDTIEIEVQIVSSRKIIQCEYKCIANRERIVLEGNAKLVQRLQTLK